MRIPCAVEADLRRYYKQLDEECARDDAIEHEIDRLMSEPVDTVSNAAPPNLQCQLAEVISDIATHIVDHTEPDFDPPYDY